MNNLRDFVVCVERIKAASTEEELAEAKSDLAALSNRSIGWAVGVSLARAYFERPAVLPLVLGSVIVYIYFGVGSLFH